MADLLATAVVDRPHAKLSPSGWERAENCSQSVRLSRHAPLRLAGPEAQAGTVAHSLLEHALTNGLDMFELGLDEGATLQVDGAEVEVTDEMLDSVQLVLDWVRANMVGPLWVEKQVRLPFADPYLGSPMFGWIDVATQSGPPWTIADAKFGFNVVEADTVQLLIYLLGLALEQRPELDLKGHAGTVVIIQPNARAAPVRTKEYSWADLRAMKARIIKTLIGIQKGEWSYSFGDWCRYCPAAGICPHLQAIALDPALTQISPSPEIVAQGELSRARLEDLIDRAEVLEHFLKRLYATAEDYLIHGGKLRNRKLIRKRTNRHWKAASETVVVGNLKMLGVADPWTHKIMSPAQAEKALPKGKRRLLADLVEQPLGELTMAPHLDPKPEIETGATLRAAVVSTKARGFLAAVPSPSRVLDHATYVVDDEA